MWKQDLQLLALSYRVEFDSYLVYHINNTNHEYNKKLHESKACIIKYVVFKTMNS